MSSKKIIITGALGQDGRILSELLINKGFNVYGFIKKNYKFKVKKVRYKYINLNNIKKCEEEIKKIKPSHIVHFGSSNPSFKDNNNFYRNNYAYSKNIIDAIIKINKDIKFIFSNSSQIFKKSG